MNEENESGESENDDYFFDNCKEAKLPNFLPRYDDHKIVESAKKKHENIVQYKGVASWEDEYSNCSKNGKEFRVQQEKNYTGLLTGNDKNLKLMWRDIDMIIRSMYEHIERNLTEIDQHYEKRMKYLESRNFRLEQRLCELMKKKT